MKRILVLNYEFPPLGGGASPVSYEISKGYVSLGHQVDVVTMGFKGLPSFEVKDGINIYRVKCWRSKKEICHPWEQLTYLIVAWFKCKELLRNNKYDICHCHFIIPTGILALKLKKKFGLQYIVTSHGSDVLGYNARFKFLYPFLVNIWRNIIDNAQKIISPSNFLKTEILKVYTKFDSEKIVVIPNGIDINKFKPQEKKKYILSSGRLLINKGFQYLIQAVSNEDIGHEVHIAGDGPMMNELKKLSKKSKTKIVFHGWLDNNGKEYRDLLEQSVIFVLVSEKENASSGLLEAMSAGCAIVTTNVFGCVETVGGAGLLVNPKDVKDLQLKINGIVNDQDKLAELQKLAVEKVNGIYDWNIILNEYVKVL